MNTHNKIYINCPKKLQARLDTIITPYKNLFGNMPENKQYWTMCANHNIDGKLGEGTELHQLLSDGFIKEHMFHGVDRELNVIKQNEKLKIGNWHYGDFYSVITEQEDFNPAIINYDSINMPYIGVPNLFDIINLLERRKIKNVMVVGNFITYTRKKSITIEEFKNLIINHPDYSELIYNGWTHLNSIYEYSGTGNKSKTNMASVIFYKKE